MFAGSLISTVVNLNGPGRYLHWSVFTVSEANLVLIVVMVVIFGAALLIPFPGHTRRGAGRPTEEQHVADEHHVEAPHGPPSAGDLGDDADAAMWTSRVRRAVLRGLPPGKLLPDRQPAYVASWIYVFGVLSLASLVMIIASGSILSLKGPAWWHVTGVGHFFNSIHLWSVELFFFVMVVHLWGKYWMAAWRGGRGRVWVTGAIVFLSAYGWRPPFD